MQRAVHPLGEPAAESVDLLVLGAGMAGLAAAARAAQEGASVVLVEKGTTVGGSAAYAGFIWTAPSVETMREVNPEGDPALGRRLVEDFGDAVAWVRGLGVVVNDPVTVLGYGRGCLTDMAGLLATCERAVCDAPGGELLLGAQPARLLLEDGAVRGAQLTLRDGTSRTVRARSTLLATGGYGGDRELRADRIDPLARDIPLRANPHSTGDGLRLALDAGCDVAGRGAGFYGHLIPSRVPYDDPLEFTNLSFYHSEHSVLVNLDGRRFVDETIGDHLSTLAVLEQPQARALMICDQRVHDHWMMGTPYVKGVEPVDRFARAYRLGARAAIAEEIDEFADLPDEWGYPGAAVRDTLLAFNRACQDGSHDPSRRLDAAPLLDPPYYVIELIPAITFTFEGIRIDPHARALDARGEPIPGLLAAGADAGGVFSRAYVGGIANALVFGLQAAATALAAPAVT